MIVEANPVEGMSTLVAICDYDAGLISVFGLVKTQELERLTAH